MDLIENIKRSGVSVAELSTHTGIPTARIYKWLDGSAKPKHEDSKKLEVFLNNKPIVNENADLSKQIGTIEERLIRLEGYATILFDTAVQSLSLSSGKSSAIVRAELQQALTMVLTHSLEELGKKR